MSTKGLWAIVWLSIIYGAITAVFALFVDLKIYMRYYEFAK